MDTAPIYYVYLLIRPWNGVPCYVGKGKGGRVLEHRYFGDKHYNKHLAAILRKAEGSLHHLLLVSGIDETEAFFWETKFIAALGRADQNRGPLANRTDGGDGVSGHVHSSQTRARMSQSRMGHTYLLGRKQSAEHVANRVEGRKNSSRDLDSRKNQAVGMSDWHASLSEEDKDKRGFILSSSQKKFWDSLSKEERYLRFSGEEYRTLQSEKTTSFWASLTKDQRKERGKKSAETRRRNLERAL